MSYDSRPETLEHIDQVRGFLSQVIGKLTARSDDHDKSKLVEPEVEVFDQFTPRLAESTYGSDEYKGFLKEMAPALDHHYAVNDHHPEHFPNGIMDMDLLQVVEMLCDWKAATMRHADGDLFNSIQYNAARFGYGDEIRHLLLRTAGNLGWL